MFRTMENRLASTLPLTLLMVAGAAAATGDSQLVDAARSQNFGAIRSLVGQHADVNALDASKETPLNVTIEAFANVRPNPLYYRQLSLLFS